MRRHALAKADAPTRAVRRSTTLVNSSTTARAGASQIKRASMARKRSPVLKTRYGRSQAGTSPSPTADRAAVTACQLPPASSGAMASTMGASLGQGSPPRMAVFPQIRSPMLDLPEPDGPTTRPICHGSTSEPSMGRSASRSKPMPSTLKRERTSAAR